MNPTDNASEEFPVEFIEWAFGTGRFKDELAMMNHWNETKGTLLMLKPDGNMYDDLRKMKTIYLNEKEKNHEQ